MSSRARPASTPRIDEWLEQARCGSRDALGKLFDICRDYLIVIAREETDPDLRAKAGASDIVQETFLDAQRAFVRFRGQSEGELLAWLREILRCHVANLRRQYYDTAKRNIAREAPLALDAAQRATSLVGTRSKPPTPSWHAVNREEVERVDAAVQKLPIDYQRVIMLVSCQHRSFAEAGAQMGRSADAARRLWGRAIEKLAAELQDDKRQSPRTN